MLAACLPGLMHLNIAGVPRDSLLGQDTAYAEPIAAVCHRVVAARQRAVDRGRESNAQLPTSELASICALDDSARNLLICAMQSLNLSARGYHRILQLAHAIADLAGTADIGSNHVVEAVDYRAMDRGTD